MKWHKISEEFPPIGKIVVGFFDNDITRTTFLCYFAPIGAFMVVTEHGIYSTSLPKYWTYLPEDVFEYQSEFEDSSKKHFTEWMEESRVNPESLADIELRYINPDLLHSKRLLLKDGTSLSIQAGYQYGCTIGHDVKRLMKYLPYKCYATFEIGFPNKEIPEIFCYAENEGNYLTTIYHHVPKEVIEQLIEKRGGIIGYGESD